MSSRYETGQARDRGNSEVMRVRASRRRQASARQQARPNEESRAIVSKPRTIHDKPWRQLHRHLVLVFTVPHLNAITSQHLLKPASCQPRSNQRLLPRKQELQLAPASKHIEENHRPTRQRLPGQHSSQKASHGIGGQDCRIVTKTEGVSILGLD